MDWLELNGLPRRLSYTQRWPGYGLMAAENVAEHSFWVAWYSVQLMSWLQEEKKIFCDPGHVLTVALVHDMPEAITGDMARPVKHDLSPRFRQAHAEMEQLAIKIIMESLPKHLKWLDQFMLGGAVFLTDTERDVIKFADMLSALAKLKDEWTQGNQFARQGVYHICKGYMEEWKNHEIFRPLAHSVVQWAVNDIAPKWDWTK